MKKMPTQPTAIQDPQAVPRLSTFFKGLWQSPGRKRSLFRALLQTALLLLLCIFLMATLVLTVSMSMVSITSERISTEEALAESFQAGKYD